MRTVIDFTEGGIHYHAEKGFAFAKKDGKKLWQALDVFTCSEPTKEVLMDFHNFMMNQFDKAFDEADNEEAEF